jgi:pyruvate ferredoxin oxidoreductase gamma subunit
MYRIRLHGRGGQGIKTAGRILGTALFLEGFEVQDAPRYGAERRGAPILAMVRADRRSINERGIVTRPDLVVVVDETLIGLAGAGVTSGLHAGCVVLVMSNRFAEEWKTRLQAPGRVVSHPPGDGHVVGARAVGAAARLLGVISREKLASAADVETADMPSGTRAAVASAALGAFDEFQPSAGLVREAQADSSETAVPEWVDLQAESANTSAPAIHRASNVVEIKTGLWRSLRPVVHEDKCHRCLWICGTACPDSAILKGHQGYPVIDLEHCKGCMICVAECPSHAIEALPEKSFNAAGEERGTSKSREAIR